MGVALGTPKRIINNFNVFEVIAPLTLSGSYPGTPGDTLSLAGIDGAPSNSVPDLVEIYEQPPAGTSASGLVYRFGYGTTQANGQLQVFVTGTGGAGLAQLGNVTYASVNAANLVIRAVFAKFI